MKVGDKVRVISGKNKGKIGTISGFMRASQAQKVIPGKDCCNMEGAKTSWKIVFEDGSQDLIEEKDLEIIN